MLGRAECRPSGTCVTGWDDSASWCRGLKQSWVGCGFFGPGMAAQGAPLKYGIGLGWADLRASGNCMVSWDSPPLDGSRALGWAG